MTEAVLLDSLRAACDAGRRALQADFRSHGDAPAVLSGRTALADRTLTSLVASLFPPGGPEQGGGYCLLAIGGYGRRALFPCSDLDVLLLCANKRNAEATRAPAAALVRALWDLGWRAAVTSRLLEECDCFEQDNPEFSISLLDNRPITGDAALAADLRQKILPAAVAREHGAFVRSLAEMTRERHEKHGNTLFHLEPNLKDAPGGLRDYDVACWATALHELASHGASGRSRGWTAPENGWGELLV
jgi:[protein-PII] uridylyltransferase